MNDRERNDEELVDLGQASLETKGDAIFGVDNGGLPLSYVTGIAED